MQTILFKKVVSFLLVVSLLQTQFFLQFRLTIPFKLETHLNVHRGYSIMQREANKALSVMPSSFELSSVEERQRTINELMILEQELTSLKKDAKIYKKMGNSNLFFLSEQPKVHSETKLSLEKLKEIHSSIQKKSIQIEKLN